MCPTCILESDVSDGETIILVANEFYAVRIDVSIFPLPDDGQLDFRITQDCTVHADVLEYLKKRYSDTLFKGAIDLLCMYC